VGSIPTRSHHLKSSAYITEKLVVWAWTHFSGCIVFV
jgi:hypothetical protein